MRTRTQNAENSRIICTSRTAPQYNEELGAFGGSASFEYATPALSSRLCVVLRQCFAGLRSMNCVYVLLIISIRILQHKTPPHTHGAHDAHTSTHENKKTPAPTPRHDSSDICPSLSRALPIISKPNRRHPSKNQSSGNSREQHHGCGGCVGKYTHNTHERCIFFIDPRAVSSPA